MEQFQVGDLTFQLDYSKPLYEQIINQFRIDIAQGHIQLGTRMLSVRDLAKGLKVNPNTVMRAYQELERDNLFETRRGHGTFVTSSQQKVEELQHYLATQAVDSFITSIKSIGITKESAITLIEEADWK
ncbi:GntR family transcriptional regulator [Paenibacillus albiflavus]|uniref:GntR family transcriptional regulator n=1 Tax=Paenibacillus albiflavus TaxID=2545760 RepID=A0A4R4E600_9BACL|nr:GntR family transcriptional regulator [Paenibacillus albiflavus]TCZ75094.1 GntR family transcriptional regulator [Paenibacillus albiflavus]